MSPTVPILVRCWHDEAGDTVRLEVLRIDTHEPVRLADGRFLVRFVTQGDEANPRHYCYVRHIASGLETYVFGGPGLRRFVHECLRPGPAEGERPGAID